MDALEINIEKKLNHSQKDKYHMHFLSFVVPRLFNRDAENHIYMA